MMAYRGKDDCEATIVSKQRFGMGLHRLHVQQGNAASNALYPAFLAFHQGETFS